jgi:hypothetical protein
LIEPALVCDTDPYFSVEQAYRLFRGVSYEFNGYACAWDGLTLPPAIVVSAQPSEPSIKAAKLASAPSIMPKRGLRCRECPPDAALLNDLSQHLWTQHQMQAEVYRAKWGLPFDEPFVSSDHQKAKACFLRLSRLGSLCPDCRTRKICCTETMAQIGVNPIRAKGVSS